MICCLAVFHLPLAFAAVFVVITDLSDQANVDLANMSLDRCHLAKSIWHLLCRRLIPLQRNRITLHLKF